MYRGVALTIILVLLSWGTAGAFQVPDTGIAECYDESGAQITCPTLSTDTYYGQDGNFAINTMSYTDNNDGTVTDAVTGLMWQQTDVAAATWAAAVDYCNNLVQGGYSDWRLPTLEELDSLADLSVTTGAMINPVFTISCPGDDCGFWSYDTNPDNISQAWIYNYGTAEDGIADKSGAFQIRAVRGVN